jgi:hypothetical protein
MDGTGLLVNRGLVGAIELAASSGGESPSAAYLRSETQGFPMTSPARRVVAASALAHELARVGPQMGPPSANGGMRGAGRQRLCWGVARAVLTPRAEPPRENGGSPHLLPRGLRSGHLISGGIHAVSVVAFRRTLRRLS